MKLIESFDPSATSEGTFDPQTANACGRIYLFNESAIGIQLNFQDGSVQSLPPYYFRSYKVSRPGPVEWKELYSIQGIASPLSVVIGESYESSEAKDITFTEGPLNRQTNIANPIPIETTTTVASVANNNNPSGLVFLESTVQGDTNSAVSITNDAQIQFGSALYHAVLSVLGTMGITGVLTAAAGVDTGLIGHSGAINIQVAAQQSAQFSPGGIDTFILGGGAELIATLLQLKNASGTAQFAADSSGNINIDHPIGTRIAQFNSGGLDLKSSGSIVATASVQLPTGNITRLSIFSGTGTNTYTHGLGAAPDIVLPICSVVGSETLGYDTPTSTTVHITNPTGLAFRALAFKA